MVRQRPAASWQVLPFLRILPAFITGIYLGYKFPQEQKLLLSSITILTISLALLQFRNKLQLLVRARIQGGVIYLLIILLGVLVCRSNQVRPDAADELSRIPHTLTARVTEPLSGKKRWKRTLLELKNMECRGQTYPLGFSVLAYFDSTHTVLPSEGDLIRFTHIINPIMGTGNPGGFEWDRYWKRKNIRYQLYFNNSDRFTFKGTEKEILKLWLSGIRQWTLLQIRNNIPDSVTAGLGEALLIGYKDDLDKQLLEGYMSTGLMHIIAISGMHLGLIYAVLLWALRLIPLPNRFVALRLLFIVSILWLFSLLTGAGPSIVRAAMMFSMMAFGSVLKRRNSVVNSLLGSAFLLLCIHPAWLFDTGFQLSYFALLSILLFHSYIYHLLSFRAKTLDLIWNLISVTLAAQILTAPICIYYFHQFPLYFLPANLVAVPMSSIILIGELILCGLAFSPFLSQLAGKTLWLCMEIMNKAVHWIAQWPGAVWEPLHFSIGQTILIYVAIFFMTRACVNRKKNGLWISSVALVACLLIRAIQFQQANTQSMIILFSSGSSGVMDIVEGRRSYFFQPDSIASVEKIEKIRKEFHDELKVHEVATFNLRNKQSFLIRYKKQTILAIDKGEGLSADWHQKKIDLLWVRNNASPPEAAGKIYRIKWVVLDGSVTSRKANIWKNLCIIQHIPLHWVVEKGAFVMNGG
jgi:competence protein ComEC